MNVVDDPNIFPIDSSSESEASDHDIELEGPKKKNIEESTSHFDDSEFLKYFHVSKNVVNKISKGFEQSSLFHNHAGKNDKISAKEQVLVFLWFAGHETTSHRDIADHFHISVSSLCRINRRLIYYLSNLAPQLITWPDTKEKQEIESYFRNRKMPGAIGAIDLIHIKIPKPAKDPYAYYNRKKFFSTQLQIVCDHRKKIRSVFIGFPGSVNTATVFQRSPLSEELPNKCGANFIVANNAYRCTKHLITPFRDPENLTLKQRKFNTNLENCRDNIKQCFSILRQKFRQLNYCKLRNIHDIVNFIRACCVLYNMSLDDEFVFTNSQETEPISEECYSDENNDNLQADFPDGVVYRNYLLRFLK